MPASDPERGRDELHDLLLRQCEVLENAIVAFVEGRLDGSTRENARVVCHQLSGSAGSMGFPAASVAARELGQLLRSSTDETAAGRAAELIEELRTCLAREVDAPAEPDDDLPTTTVLVHHHDTGFVESLHAAARSRGMRCVQDGGTPEADVALVEIHPPHDVDRIAELADRGVPVVAMVDQADVDGRLASLDAGARVIVGLPSALTATLDALEEAAGDPRRAPPLILIGPCDVGTATYIEGLADIIGARTVRTGSATSFWLGLDEHEPELVILPDTDGPTSSDDLCRAVRTDPRWWMTPVVAFREDESRVESARTAGADDVIVWPGDITGSNRRIRSLIDRARRTRRQGGRDTLTGLATQARLEEEMPRLIALADRYETPLSLCLIELDGLTTVASRHGRRVADAIVKRLAALLQDGFRDEDVAARMGESSFAVALYGMDRSDGVQRVADVLDALRAETIPTGSDRMIRATFSAGIAQWGEDADALDAFTAAAEGALRHAQSLGGDRVLSVDWQQAAPSDSINVVVVEDDVALSGALLHALKTRGHRSAWFADGREAAERLVGSNGDRLSPKVIILDHDLPGLNGSEVLAELDHHGVLDRTRVIMLTVRGTEEETVELLRAGATDHVTKPFSMPVLMQRLRRAMNDTSVG